MTVSDNIRKCTSHAGRPFPLLLKSTIYNPSVSVALPYCCSFVPLCRIEKPAAVHHVLRSGWQRSSLRFFFRYWYPVYGESYCTMFLLWEGEELLLCGARPCRLRVKGRL